MAMNTMERLPEHQATLDPDDEDDRKAGLDEAARSKVPPQFDPTDRTRTDPRTASDAATAGEEFIEASPRPSVGALSAAAPADGGEAPAQPEDRVETPASGR